MVILFVGLLLIILGLVSLFYATKLKPNYLVGYRSYRANKTQESYLAANKYAGRFLIIEGLITLVLSFFSRMIPYKLIAISGLGYFLLTAIIMFLATESHLKKIYSD